MNNLDMGQRPGINFELLDKQLRAAFPGLVTGISQDKFSNLTIHFGDDPFFDAEPYRVTAEGVLEAHNPLVLTAEQQEAAAQRQAQQDMLTTDFDQLKTAINNASAMSDLKPILRGMGRIMWRMAKAEGLVNSPDPGA